VAIREGVSVIDIQLPILLLDGIDISNDELAPPSLGAEPLIEPPSIELPSGFYWSDLGVVIQNKDSANNHKLEVISLDENVKVFFANNPTILNIKENHIGVCLSRSIDLKAPLVLEVFHTQNAKLTLNSAMSGRVLIDWGDGKPVDVTIDSSGVPYLNFYSTDMSSSPIVKASDSNWTTIKIYGDFLGVNDSAHQFIICGSALRRVIDWGEGMDQIKHIPFARTLGFTSGSLISVPNYLPPNISSFELMFSECVNLNCDLHEWDVSSANNFRGMFSNCHKFNGNIRPWNLKNVSAMNLGSMFDYCYEFDQDLSHWDLSNVTEPSLFAYNTPKFDKSKYPVFRPEPDQPIYT